MAGRELLVHITCVVGALVVYDVALGVFDIAPGSSAGVMARGMAAIGALGGLTQVVLAVRQSGDVPVRARWRYVIALIAAVGGLTVVSVMVEPSPGSWVGPVLIGWLLVVVGVYLAVEIRAGYRESIGQ